MTKCVLARSLQPLFLLSFFFSFFFFFFFFFSFFLLPVAGQLAVVQLLVQHGVNADQADELGRTPLWQAADHGHLAIVRFLVETAGADYNLPDKVHIEPVGLGHGLINQRFFFFLVLVLVFENKTQSGESLQTGLPATYVAYKRIHERPEYRDIVTYLCGLNEATPVWLAALLGEADALRIHAANGIDPLQVRPLLFSSSVAIHAEREEEEEKKKRRRRRRREKEEKNIKGNAKCAQQQARGARQCKDKDEGR